MSVVAPVAVPVLESPRLRLRALRDDDAEALLVLHGDPEVMRYWSTSPWTDIAQAHAHLQRARRDFESGGVLPWAIATAASDELIGTVTLFRIDRDHRRAEVGYALGSAHWGKGLASEALGTVLRHAFDSMQLERVEADTDPRNTSSRRMLERLGFVQEGTLRRRWFVNDEWCDTAFYGLLREDFRG
ncbi:MAG TPA: GNAT family N-acetyltransferase [Rhodanobacteraceae bacterium]|nr:GNAT family N-acetyltransferase [Rhodanobacteraceae bacterium]